MSDDRTSDIHLQVTTDENKVPTSIRWSASDAGIAQAEAKAFALSVWNGKEALSIDLWDKDMTVDEMKVFVCQSMMTLADALERAPHRTPGQPVPSAASPPSSPNASALDPKPNPVPAASGRSGWSAR